MNENLVYQLRHNVWATKTLLDACRSLSSEQLTAPPTAAYGSVIETFRHLVMSDAGYLSTLGGPQTSWVASYHQELSEVAEWWKDGPLEDAADLDELARRVDETERLWDAFLASEELDVERVLVLDDGTYECPAGIVVAQVFHHGSLHREQICAMLTGLGSEAPDLQPWAFADATGMSRFLGGRTS
jgi:uncharacterized damage-inducible protein DinB